LSSSYRQQKGRAIARKPKPKTVDDFIEEGGSAPTATTPVEKKQKKCNWRVLRSLVSRIQTLMMRAFKTGSVSALEQFLNHLESSFIIAALEDWQKTKGQTPTE
jgi:hypothetical protein